MILLGDQVVQQRAVNVRSKWSPDQCSGSIPNRHSIVTARSVEETRSVAGPIVDIETVSLPALCVYTILRLDDSETNP